MAFHLQRPENHSIPQHNLRTLKRDRPISRRQEHDLPLSQVSITITDRPQSPLSTVLGMDQSSALQHRQSAPTQINHRGLHQQAMAAHTIQTDFHSIC